MEQTKLKALELNAAKARLYGVQMVHDAASGHPGGSMGCMDVLTYLYFAEMRVDPKNPRDPARARFGMSKGHCSPAVYPVLALRGFFPTEELKLFQLSEQHRRLVVINVQGLRRKGGSLLPEYTEEEFQEATFTFVKYYVQSRHYDELVAENEKLKYDLEQELEWRHRTDS